MAATPKGPVNIHASAVAFGTTGLLILGASGTGKSSLALQLMALGATLVADDRVIATPDLNGGLRMTAPPYLQGMIEARDVGLIRVDHRPAMAVYAVTLDEVETARLPEIHDTVIADVMLPLLRKVESPAFPAMLYALLNGGRVAP
jgi:HPr kinase/phosphorylase